MCAGMALSSAVPEKGDVKKQVEAERVFLEDDSIIRKKYFCSEFCFRVNVPLAVFLF